MNYTNRGKTCKVLLDNVLKNKQEKKKERLNPGLIFRSKEIMSKKIVDGKAF